VGGKNLELVPHPFGPWELCGFFRFFSYSAKKKKNILGGKTHQHTKFNLIFYKLLQNQFYPPRIKQKKLGATQGGRVKFGGGV